MSLCKTRQKRLYKRLHSGVINALLWLAFNAQLCFAAGKTKTVLRTTTAALSFQLPPLRAEGNKKSLCHLLLTGLCIHMVMVIYPSLDHELGFPLESGLCSGQINTPRACLHTRQCFVDLRYFHGT